jgi:hypothetical protein
LNNVTCPDGSNTCYSVTITSLVPLYLSQVVGYAGDTTVNGAKEKTLSSAAVAQQTKVQQPICLLALDKTLNKATALTGNGSPTTNFTGCSIMSNSNASCNGSNLLANYGLAYGTNGGGAGCGNKQDSNIPKVPDPYIQYASAIPSQSTLDSPSYCNKSYSNETKKGSTWSGGVTWSGSKNLTGTANLAGNTLICGDLQLTGDVTINAPGGAVLFIDRGNLDLNGHTLSTRAVSV